MAKLEFRNSNIYPSPEYLDECIERTLSDVNKNSANYNFIKEIRDRINKNKDILDYVRKKGITILCLYGFLFIFYFFAIHLDYTIWRSSRWLITILPVGFWLTIYIIYRTVYYLIKCLHRDN